MDKKKATPTAAHETQHHHSNLDKPYQPKSQRERRLLAALVNGSVIRHDLDTMVGTDNGLSITFGRLGHQYRANPQI